MSKQTVMVLKRPVQYQGVDILGREAVITIRPQNDGLKTGWWWRPQAGGSFFLEISPCQTRVGKRQVQLQSFGACLPIYEHIGALRFGMAGGVEVCGQGWPPYDGRSHGLWQAVMSGCESEEVDMPLFTVSQVIRVGYDKPRGGRTAFTEIHPATDGRLTIEITRSFAGLGEGREIFSLPDEKVLKRLCQAKTLGWPPCLYRVSAVLSRLFCWPHHHQSVVWPQEHDPSDLMKEVLRHAGLDTFGIASLLCHGGRFVGRIVSVCSGHQADLAVVRLADQCLVQVD